MRSIEKFARLAAAKAIDPAAFPTFVRLASTRHPIAQAVICDVNPIAFRAESAALDAFPDTDTDR